MKDFHRLPSIRWPSTFNEKVLRRKHFGYNPIYARLADKYLVRQYVASKIGDGHLVPLVMHTPEPSGLLALDDWRRTVIKPNHGAGMMKIIGEQQPDAAEKADIIRDCEAWLRTDYSRVAGEDHYRDIPRVILVEQLLGDGVVPPNDYKFHWFNRSSGPEYVLQVVHDRFSRSAPSSRGYYLNNLHDCVWAHGGGSHAIPEEHLQLLRRAVELNKLLGAQFDYVRIDWYVHDGKLYFGELTFTPGAGRTNEFGRKLDRIMGDMWPTFRSRPV